MTYQLHYKWLHSGDSSYKEAWGDAERMCMEMLRQEAQHLARHGYTERVITTRSDGTTSTTVYERSGVNVLMQLLTRVRQVDELEERLRVLEERVGDEPE